MYTDTMKHNKPEIGEQYMPKMTRYRLNHISFQLADRVREISGMNSFYALSGSDANEGALNCYLHTNCKKAINIRTYCRIRTVTTVVQI